MKHIFNIGDVVITRKDDEIGYIRKVSDDFMSVDFPHKSYTGQLNVFYTDDGIKMPEGFYTFNEFFKRIGRYEFPNEDVVIKKIESISVNYVDTVGRKHTMDITNFKDETTAEMEVEKTRERSPFGLNTREKIDIHIECNGHDYVTKRRFDDMEYCKNKQIQPIRV